jgi:hypothetical protein
MSYENIDQSIWPDRFPEEYDDHPDDLFEVIDIPTPLLTSGQRWGVPPPVLDFGSEPGTFDVPYSLLRAPKGFMFIFWSGSEFLVKPREGWPETWAFLTPSFGKTWNPDPDAPPLHPVKVIDTPKVISPTNPYLIDNKYLKSRDQVDPPGWKWSTLVFDHTEGSGWFSRGRTITLRFAWLVPDFFEWYEEEPPFYPWGQSVRDSEYILVFNVAQLFGYPDNEMVRYVELPTLPPGFNYVRDGQQGLLTASILPIPEWNQFPTGYEGGAA